jgi:hypothetical protein
MLSDKLIKFSLNNPIDFTLEYIHKTPKFKRFIKEIQKKIPEYINCISEEWETNKETDCIIITTTSFNLQVLLEDCGFYKSFRTNQDKKVVVKIYAYEDEDDDNHKEIFLEIDDDDEIPTFSLYDNNLVGSLYYFIKHL